MNMSSGAGMVHVMLDNLRLLWARVTLSRFTIIYFTLSIIHCVVQVVFQSQAFSINAQAVALLTDLVNMGNATQPGFMVATGNQLRMCDYVPTSMSADDCDLMWMQSSSDGTSTSSSSPAPSSSSSSSSMEYQQSLVGGVHTSSSVATSPAVTSAVSSVSSAVISVSASSSSAVVSNVSPSSFSAAASKAASSSASVATASRDADSSAVTVTRVATTVVQTVAGTAKTSSATAASSAAASENTGTTTSTKTRRFSVQEFAMSNGATVNITGLAGISGTVELDTECLTVLNWPVQVLEQTKREDLAFIMFQFWLLGMSLVALLNESIPHIIVSLLMHMLATAWAGFQIADTAQFRNQFNKMTTQSACNGVNLLPTYWQDRADAEIPSSALNIVALLASAFLTWRLMKSFGWQTFKRVGASLTVNRVYNVVLSLSITIQLAFFFVAVSGAIWIDQLYNTIIGNLATDALLFKAVTITVLVLLVPWLATGWIAVRRELKIPMFFFMVLSLAYLAGWSCMFISPTFRWTFVQWRFFSLVATASVLLAALALVLGVICCFNFGKGLHRYLNRERYAGEVPVSEKARMDVEKAEFPSDDMPLPTFSGAFGSIADIPPSYGGPRRLAFNPNVPLFNEGANGPSRANSVSSSSPSSLKRHDSGSSAHSGGSGAGERSPNPRRWVIE